MSRHSFEPEIAEKVGINAAVIYQNIVWWCEKNAANERNIHDGKAWTYNSLAAFETLFPYLTSKQIRLALEKLKDSGLVVTGCFNKDARDRTIWYAPAGNMHLPKRAERSAQKGRPLPDSKPVDKQTPIPPEGDLFRGDLPKQDDPTEDEQFDRFWAAFPKKAGKPAARKAFSKAIKRAPAEVIIRGAERYASWLSGLGPRDFKPTTKHPQGWLNDDRWNDDVLRDQPTRPRRSYADRRDEILRGEAIQ